MKKNIIIIFAVLLFTACSPTMSRVTIKDNAYRIEKIESKPIGPTSTKSYKKNEEQFVTVGATMFNIIEYKDIQNRVVYVTKGLQGIFLDKTINFELEAKRNGVNYLLLGPVEQNLDGSWANSYYQYKNNESTYNRKYYILVNTETGIVDIPFKFYNIQGELKESSGPLVGDEYGETKAFLPVDLTKPVLKIGKMIEKDIPIDIKYELIYNGIDDKSIRISYREYTSNDMARPAFYTNLTYNKNQKILTFKNFKIEVIKANNQGIRFKIMKDNLSPDLTETKKKFLEL